MSDEMREAFERWVQAGAAWPLDKYVSGNYEDENCQAAWQGFKCAYKVSKAVYEQDMQAALASKPQVTDSVKMPTSSEEAQLMVGLGLNWLENNDTEALKPQVTEGEVEQFIHSVDAQTIHGASEDMIARALLQQFEIRRK